MSDRLLVPADFAVPAGLTAEEFRLEPLGPQHNAADYAAWTASIALHHIRDVTYGEDTSQIRTSNGPQVMATFRNLGIAILKAAGHASIAAACRYHARDATRVLATLGLSPP